MTYAVEACSIGKAFGGRKALVDISFSLPEGAFLSVFGPNGAGKTTLLRILATLIKPTSGKAFIFDRNVKEDADKIREDIGVISHHSMLYADLTAYENLMFAAQLYGVADAEARTNEMLDAVGLSHRRFDIVREFSRGMTQRISIARALIHDPRVILLDEPYSGLDPHAVGILDRLIEDLKKDKTCIMVSHDLQKGFTACSHALVLAQGKKLMFEKKENIDQETFAEHYRQVVGVGLA